MSRRFAAVLIIAVPVALFVASAWHLRWMVDDGYIHLRVVQNILAGHGPVYNASERVEIGTSPAWVWLLTGLTALTPVALPWVAVVAGVVGTAVGLIAAYRARLCFEQDGLVIPLGVMMLAALLPFREWTTSGMETGPVFCWLGLCCWWIARRATTDSPPPKSRADYSAAWLIGMGWLIHPDLVIFSVAFAAVHLAAMWPLGPRRMVRMMAAMWALPIAYQVFRMGYYAELVPNAALAKEASVPKWDLGWDYFTGFLGSYVLWLPLIALIGLLAWSVRLDLRAGQWLPAAARAAPALAALVHTLYVVRFGGDNIGVRMSLFELFAIVAPVGVNLPRRRAQLVPAAVVAMWVVLAAILTHDPVEQWGEANSVTPAYWGGWYQAEEPGLGMARIVPPDFWEDADVVPARLPAQARSVGAVQHGGMTPVIWGTEVHAIDVFGLGNPIAGHLEGLSDDAIGHQKLISHDWSTAEFSHEDELWATDGRLLAGREFVRAARRAMQCGQLARYLDDIRQPLTVGRFVGNIAHSFANTTFRIPRDPVEAERKFCGGN